MITKITKSHMRTLIVITTAIAASSCGVAPSAGIASFPGANTYVITVTGDGGQVAAVINGVSEPSSSYQVQLPSGGGTATVPAGGTLTLTVSDVRANPQISHYGTNPVTVTLKKNGSTISTRTLSANGESYNWGYL